MAFSILPLTASDIPTATTIYLSAFSTNAHSLACFPRSSSSVRKWWEDMIRDELDEDGASWFKAVDPSSNEIACFAKWVRVQPGDISEPGNAGLPSTWPEGADEKLCIDTFGTWAARKKEIIGSRRHYYLEIIATSPSYQGRGAASQIIRWGLEKADAEGLECYLEASPDAVQLYEKFGFAEVGRTENWIENERVNGGKGLWYVDLFMVRSGKEGSGEHDRRAKALD